MKAELQRCRADLGQMDSQLRRLDGVPVQVLKKALCRAGITPDRIQDIIDANITHINTHSSLPITRTTKIPIKRKSTNPTNTFARHSSPHNHYKKESSIAATIVALYPTPERGAPGTSASSGHHLQPHDSWATTLNISTIAHPPRDQKEASSSSPARRSLATVTREDVQPLVFHRLPGTVAPPHQSTSLPGEGRRGEEVSEWETTLMQFEGLDLCAESISGASLSHACDGEVSSTPQRGRVRVNRAAALRQKHAAERSKQFEKEKHITRHNKKTKKHKPCWSTALVSHTSDDDFDEEPKRHTIDRDHSNFKEQNGRLMGGTGAGAGAGAGMMFSPGQPWVTACISSSTTHHQSTQDKQGGMFFEVTGNKNDFEEDASINLRDNLPSAAEVPWSADHHPHHPHHHQHRHQQQHQRQHRRRRAGTTTISTSPVPWEWGSSSSSRSGSGSGSGYGGFTNDNEDDQVVALGTQDWQDSRRASTGTTDTGSAGGGGGGGRGWSVELARSRYGNGSEYD